MKAWPKLPAGRSRSLAWGAVAERVEEERATGKLLAGAPVTWARCQLPATPPPLLTYCCPRYSYLIPQYIQPLYSQSRAFVHVAAFSCSAPHSTVRYPLSLCIRPPSWMPAALASLLTSPTTSRFTADPGPESTAAYTRLLFHHL